MSRFGECWNQGKNRQKRKVKGITFEVLSCSGLEIMKNAGRLIFDTLRIHDRALKGTLRV